MENMNKTDKEFLIGVERKIRYLDYVKAEEALVEKNIKALRRKNLITALIFLMLTLVSILILKAFNFDMGIVTFISILAFSLTGIYEYANSTGNTILSKTNLKR